MKNFLEFDDIDKKLWLGILGISAVGIILLSLFTSTSLFGYVARFLITVFIMFLPGYAICKLFFDKLKLSDFPTLDRFLASFFFSIASVQTLYFLSTYVRTYGLNVDEDVISSDTIAIVLAVLVIGGAFATRYYLNRKASAAS